MGGGTGRAREGYVQGGLNSWIDFERQAKGRLYIYTAGECVVWIWAVLMYVTL